MSQEDTRPAEYQFPKKQITWALVAIFAVYGLVAFSVQSLNIARPKIAADLDGLALYGWSASIPALIMAMVTIIFGKFSDMYGRRIMLMIALIAAGIGTVLSALSPNFIFLIVASAVAALGAGAMMPLVFAVVGDLFPPGERGKWVGLLNIPLGLFTLTGPVLGGYIVDTLNWRYLFWLTIPLLAFCLITVPVGVPSLKNRDSSRKIDIKGCIWAALASSATIIGFSLAGTTYPWLSVQIIGLLGGALVFWIIFLWIESGATEPVLDLEVLRNRSFWPIATATFFSTFGTMAIMMYFPMFLQGVQGISTTRSGLITAPFGFLTALMGIPIGYMVAKSGRFKWMYIVGYGTLTMSMFGLIFFNQGTSVGWSLLVGLLAGMGYGVIPTINTIVVQNAVPKRLMGAAMGAIFFFLMIGNAVAPAILGSTQNLSYANALSRSLPEGLRDVVDEKTMITLDDPQVLLSETAMKTLSEAFQDVNGNGPQLFQQTVDAIRHSLEACLRSIFWLGGITSLLAFLVICTVPAKTAGAEE